MIARLYTKLLRPRAISPDEIRRERIITLLIFVFGLIMVALTTISVIGSILEPSAHPLLLTELAITLVLAGLYLLARHHYYILAGNCLIALLWTVCFMLMGRYGISLTSSQLLAAALIGMAGIMLNARQALIHAAIATFGVLLVSYLNICGAITSDITWRLRPPMPSDAFGYAAILGFIGLLSWLSSREVDSLLRRARASERALQAEKVSLEKRVQERTQALEMAHLEQSLLHHRVISFGQLYANLVHDMINPLTTASLQIERLQAAGIESDATNKARHSLDHVQNYINNARQWLNGQSHKTTFSVRSELSEAVKLVKSMPQFQGVILTLRVTEPSTRIHGDTVRFNQIITNLIINGIQAYPEESKVRRIKIYTTHLKSHIKVHISDYGKGLPPDAAARVFEPFYSQRADGSHGLGIGLYLVKQYVTQDFHGTIQLKPAVGHPGTEAVIKLPTTNKK